jgi:hypothetical protein
VSKPPTWLCAGAETATSSQFCIQKPCEPHQHAGALEFCEFLLINILETTGKLLFFMVFRSSPNKLWITLLKTLRDGPQSLEK